jgi:hypothetical protein
LLRNKREEIDQLDLHFFASPEPGDELGRETGDVLCRERPGGMLRDYYREAA